MVDLEALISKMSLEEKVLQLLQTTGELYNPDESGKLMGNMFGIEIDDYMAWNAGSVLGLEGAEAAIRLQNEHMEKSAHKIPLMFMHDVIHGYRTIFPAPLALACSWQPELAEKASLIAAKEASAAGTHVTFAPMADLSRDARWGRVIESFGEDVMLNSLFSEASVRGFQGDDPKEKDQLAACVKHFAGYGMAEGGRDYNTTEISENALREYHLPTYKAALNAGSKMVMTAFNALNGVPCTGNKWLFGDILRGEWEFDGVVISDCTAIGELVLHGFADDNDEAALKALKAGVDIEMVSTTYYRGVKSLIEQGLLSEDEIDTAVMRVLQFKETLGLFDNPHKGADPKLEEQLLLCREHRDAARNIATECMVLLKNESVLPLRKSDKKIAIVGNYADNKDILDIWRCTGKPEDCISVAEGLQGKLEFNAINGCSDEALELVRASDVIILAIGETPEMSAEAGSRASIELPEEEKRFTESVLQLGKQVIAVVFAGRPMDLGMLNEKANAILYVWFPGTEGGNAIADILLGEKEPSGRLTISFPVSTGQCPIYYNALPTGRPTESLEESTRFRTGYVDAPTFPRYPFGYGLTYTDFTYSAAELSKDTLCKGESITASITLANTGKRPGTEVVQLYIRDMAGSVSRPIRELKDFTRVKLNVGEKRAISFEITEEMLRFYTLSGEYKSEPGRFKVFIGENAHCENSAEFRLFI